MLNHPAIQTYIGKGRLLGRDTEPAEDIVITAELGTENALMRNSSD
ncbi:MAG: hypothetical protein IIA92_07780 [Chloroflexi bacterium]|nr:hypothetical protein [Chloroflexota bacterium]